MAFDPGFPPISRGRFGTWRSQFTPSVSAGGTVVNWHRPAVETKRQERRNEEVGSELLRDARPFDEVARANHALPGLVEDLEPRREAGRVTRARLTGRPPVQTGCGRRLNRDASARIYRAWWVASDWRR